MTHSESVWWTIGRLRVLDRALRSRGASSSDRMARLFWVWNPVALDRARLPFTNVEFQTLSEECYQA